MSRKSFPEFYGCLTCFAHLRAVGEVAAAHEALAAVFALEERTGVVYELPREANKERIRRAIKQAEMEQRGFDLHDCEHKEEQEEWAQKLKG